MRSRRPLRPALRPGLVAVAVLALVAGPACSGDDDDDDDVDRSTPDGGAAALTEPDALVGRTFVADAVTEDGEPRPLVDGTQIEVSFGDEGRVTARAGCNTIGGTVDVGPDRLVVIDVSITEMGCDPALHDQDELLLGLLQDGPGYTLDGDRLVLTAGTTSIDLESPTATPTVPLEGTRWQLDSLVDGDTVGSVPGGSGATLQLAAGTADVTVEGCNSGSAPYTASDDTVVFGALQSTLMACAGPAGEVEAAVHAVLVDDVAYTLDGDVLTLTHPSGKGLVLRPAE